MDRLAGAQILNESRAGLSGRRIDGEADLVSDADAKVVPEGCIVRNPLVKGLKGSVAVEEETSLQKSIVAGVAVNADPGACTGLAAAADARHGHGSSDLCEARGILHSAGPVAGVVVGTGDGLVKVRDSLVYTRCRYARHLRALKSVAVTKSGAWRTGGGNTEERGNDSGVLHGDGVLKSMRW